MDVNTSINTEHLASAIRGARNVLNWSQTKLAKMASISVPTLARIELCGNLKLSTFNAIMSAFEAQGVLIKFLGEEIQIFVDMNKRLDNDKEI